MSVFWILVIILTAAVIAGLLPALFRARPAPPERTHNRELHEIRLAELRRDVEDEVIAEADLPGAQDEIARALLEEAGTTTHRDDESGAATRWLSGAIVLCFVPAIAVLTYLKLGEPELATGAIPTHSVEAQFDQQKIDDMIASLERRLVEDPHNVEGWILLGRTYMALNRYDEAVPALARANELVGDEPKLMLQYADALAMSNGGRIGDDARALVTRALELEPDNSTGLWLGGLAAAQAGDQAQALDYLRRARQRIMESGDSTGELDAMIHGLEAKTGAAPSETPPIAAASPSPSASITVRIDVDPTLRSRITEQDILFVFARAPGKGGPPLAVTRVAVGNLPREIVLDDSMSMAPMFKLRAGETVAVTARISKSGAPDAQPGDLQDASEPFVVGETPDIDLVIDRVVE
jgi:cytochrome c-type biogenesis protein CcmH